MGKIIHELDRWITLKTLVTKYKLVAARAVSTMDMNSSWSPLVRPRRAPNVISTVADIISASGRKRELTIGRSSSILCVFLCEKILDRSFVNNVMLGVIIIIIIPVIHHP